MTPRGAAGIQGPARRCDFDPWERQERLHRQREGLDRGPSQGPGPHCPLCWSRTHCPAWKAGQLGLHPALGTPNRLPGPPGAGDAAGDSGAKGRGWGGDQSSPARVGASAGRSWAPGLRAPASCAGVAGGGVAGIGLPGVTVEPRRAGAVPRFAGLKSDYPN